MAQKGGATVMIEVFRKKQLIIFLTAPCISGLISLPLLPLTSDKTQAIMAQPCTIVKGLLRTKGRLLPEER